MVYQDPEGLPRIPAAFLRPRRDRCYCHADDSRRVYRACRADCQRPSVKHCDHQEAVTEFATALVYRERKPDAEHWYRKAAEAGVRGAMNGLGNLLMDRAGFAAAKAWYLRAARLGDMNAKLNLTHLHRRAGERDEAERWAREAATGGSGTGMYYLGVLLAERDND